MLVSHQCRFIYLKTMKTGSTAVEVYFEPFCTDPKTFVVQENKPSQVSEWGIVGSRGAAEGPWWNHMPAAEVRRLLGETMWHDYTKFCVVRNPFDKVVSHFWYDLGQDRGRLLQAADFSTVRQAFHAWLQHGRFPIDRVIYTIDNQPAVDRFIRYETLADDMRATCTTLALPWQPKRLLRFKTGFRLRPEHFAAYYDHAGAALIALHYAWELNRFRYTLT